jgi:triacylglycerol lipase
MLSRSLQHCGFVTLSELSPVDRAVICYGAKIESSHSTIARLPHPVTPLPMYSHPVREASALPNRSTRNPILLIHGITDTSHKMRKIASHLSDLGWQVYTIDLRPNNGSERLEVLARQVADLVDRILAPHQHIDIIGFSMGGLVARYYIQRLGGIDRVQRFITISSPHRGTLSAYFSTRPGCAQMRPDSKFMRDLDRDVSKLNRLNFTSMWTPFDAIILPPSSSQLGIGTELVFPVLAHPLMVFDRRCLDAIATALTQPTKSPI